MGSRFSVITNWASYSVNHLVSALLVCIGLWAAFMLYAGVSMILGYFGNPTTQIYELANAMAAIAVVNAVVISFQTAICVLPTSIIQGISLTLIFECRPSVSIPGTFGLTILSSLVTLYAYDYLIPSFRWYTDESPDWVHGITPLRFGLALGLQVSILLFGWLRLSRRRQSSQTVL
jgi:hypothetical protein